MKNEIKNQRCERGENGVADENDRYCFEKRSFGLLPMASVRDHIQYFLSARISDGAIDLRPERRDQ